jgi:nucleoside 2-deoxyribosyltransferase
MRQPVIYLAAGWFDPEQKRQMDEVYEVLSKLKEEGKIRFFSPFYDGVVLKKDDPDLRNKMKAVWELDIAKVVESDLIVACTVNHDVGSIFECGYGSAMGVKILCFNSTPEHGLNLMLAQEARGFAKTKKDLKAAIESFAVALNERKEEDWVWNAWSGDPI